MNSKRLVAINADKLRPTQRERKEIKFDVGDEKWRLRTSQELAYAKKRKVRQRMARESRRANR